ncbi:MAG: 2-amino-4-hydroxy-6-hydroxymethyldihydropteridine diphosphokinase [Planctomycetia bacterium]
MARCLIACGSNQGRPRQHLHDARELLRSMPGVTLLAASRPRETRPIGGPAGQPPFMNGAFLVDTEFAPDEMLGVLTAIENTLHRERQERWGPRTIDLDLLLYDDLVIEQPGLTVPHPRMATRRFVLEPCAEIAPDFVHPVSGCSVRDLLDTISEDHPDVAVIGVPGSGAPEVAAAVANVWLNTVLLDVHDVLPDDPLAPAFKRTTDAVVPPDVAILLVADPAVLEQRLTGRDPDIVVDPAAAATAVVDAPPASAINSVAAIVALQTKLRHRLLAPAHGATRRPKAVVVVEANDLDRAIGEAVAAVEAMA